MQIVYGIDTFRDIAGGKVYLALGNFDGVHTGHREILKATVEAAEASGCRGAVLIFTPHPLSVLFPERTPALLLTVEDRIRLLGEAGIDYVIVHPFTKEFAELQPEMFARDVLAQKLNVCGVVVGFDYSFGRRGSGTPGDMHRLGRQYGFAVRVVDPVHVDGKPVGSTYIRHLLSEGRVKEAAGMLGYPFYLRGTVIHGDGRGRKLGFPTANVLTPCDVILPGHGVYLTQVTFDGKDHWALTNVGKRPTFCKNEPSVEVYLLDTEKNLYEQELTVRFLQKMREEKAFATADELVGQIRQDVELARMIISQK